MNPMTAVSNPSMAMTRKQRNNSRFWSDDTRSASMNACTSTTLGVTSVVAIIAVITSGASGGIRHLRQEANQRFPFGGRQPGEQAILHTVNARFHALQHLPAGRRQSEQLDAPVVRCRLPQNPA